MSIHSSSNTCSGKTRCLRCCLFSVGLSACFLAPVGCANKPPLVADPPQHEHYAPEDVPWEEEYSRMRPRDDIFLGGGAEDAAPEPDGVTREGEGGGSFEGVLADILGFPFRGLGWILQGVF